MKQRVEISKSAAVYLEKFVPVTIWSFLLMQAVTIGLLASSSFALADFSDKPLKNVVVDLGASSYLPDPNSPHSVLSCAFFANFMVKEIDNAWVKGTVLTAIIPIGSGPPPTCTQSHDPHELYLEDGKSSWWGFWGAKGSLLFFLGADGLNGGMQFLVYDLNAQKKVFGDVADLSLRRRKKRPETSPFSGLRMTTLPDGGLALRYRRVVATDCDLRRKQEVACWHKVRASLDLKTGHVPVCDYAGINPAQQHYASAVAYPVEVSLSKQPVMKTLPGQVRCWPVD